MIKIQNAVNNLQDSISEISIKYDITTHEMIAILQSLYWEKMYSFNVPEENIRENFENGMKLYLELMEKNRPA